MIFLLKIPNQVNFNTVNQVLFDRCQELIIKAI